VPSRFDHELLRRVRLELDLGQEELAAAIGVDVRTYRRYESGAVNEGGFAVRRASQRKLLHDLCEHLGIEETELVRPSDDKTGAVAPYRPRRVHPLPRAAHFVGRDDELAELRAWLADVEGPRVLAVVAMGGAGKSTLLGRALESMADEPVHHGALVWSFYENPRTEDFLADLVGYLGQGAPCPPGERDARLLDLLSSGAPHLLVLDGLELVQADDHPGLTRGQLVDPSLRRLLGALAEGRGQSRALITTRFPLVDLAGHRGAGYRQLPLGPLARDEAVQLLSAFGVAGDLNSVVDRYGAHPLSIAMAGSYAQGFLGGDVDQLAAVELSDAGQDDALARRLAHLLDSYAQSMTDTDRQLVARLSLFAAGATPELLATASAQAVRARTTMERLCRLGLVHKTEGGRFTAHAFVRDYFRRYLVVERPPTGDGLTLVNQPAVVAADHTSDEVTAVFERAIAASQYEAAYEIYRYRLGGFDNLGLRLGDMVRGERLIRAFSPSGAVRDLPDELGLERRRAIAYDWALYLGAQGELDAALACHEAAIDYAEQRPDALVVGLRAVAYITRLQGALAQALTAIDSSVELAARHGLGANLVRSIALRGRILHDLGRVDDAVAAFATLDELGDRPVARRGVWLAEHLLDLGDTEHAIQLTEANLAECERRRWAGHVAHCHLVLTRAYRESAPARALDHLEGVERWTSLTGEVELVVGSLDHAGALRGDRSLLRAGLELARRTGFRPAAAMLACSLLEASAERKGPAKDAATRAVGAASEHALVQKRWARTIGGSPS